MCRKKRLVWAWNKATVEKDLEQAGLCSTLFFRTDSTLTHMTIQVTQLRLNSNPKFANLTQLRLNSKPKFTNLTQLWLNSFESELSQIWLTTHQILPNLGKKCWPGVWGGGVRSNVAAGSFSVKLQIIARSWRFLFEKSVTQPWLKQYPVDSTLTQMTISVIRLWLDSYPGFSRPTRLWLDSFDSESSQIWLTTHESSTTLGAGDTTFLICWQFFVIEICLKPP